MTSEHDTITELKRKAVQARKDILTMLEAAGSGHPGGSLSIVEILLALYDSVMRHKPGNPEWADRDRFILSKGHCCPALYAVLADYGYFPKEELMTLRQIGTRLQGHPQRGLPGVEISSGSLGQGLSIANGMALAARIDKRDIRIYCLMGDGEINEGQIWEAAMTAAHYKLDTLCGIVDYNKYCIDGPLEEIMGIEPIAQKWSSFGWHTLEIHGHSFEELLKAFDEAKTVKEKPTVIIAHTIKGKGVSFMECNNKWHGVAPTKDELKQAFQELNEELKKL
jgi:transketolase